LCVFFVNVVDSSLDNDVATPINRSVQIDIEHHLGGGRMSRRQD